MLHLKTDNTDLLLFWEQEFSRICFKQATSAAPLAASTAATQSGKEEAQTKYPQQVPEQTLSLSQNSLQLSLTTCFDFDF